MEVILSRLRRYAEIGDDAVSGLRSLEHTIVNHNAGATIVTIGQELTHVFVIEEGWAMRHRILPDGRRQIVNFMLPGDCFDLQALVGAKSDHFVSAITNIRMRTTPAGRFLAAMRSNPTLASAFWWAAVQEDSILREQIVRIGRRTARERIAHLLLELHRRLILQSEDTQTDTFTLPLTREIMGDALGLSQVHVSRSVSILRARKLIETNGQLVRLRDPVGLARLAQFNENYLHFDETPRLPADAG